MPVAEDSGSSTRKIVLSTLAAISSISYLDYIFNPCTLVNIEFSLDATKFKETFTNITKDTSILVVFPFMTLYLTGEVVSFQASMVGTTAGSCTVAALLLPVGVARSITTGPQGGILPERISTGGGKSSYFMRKYSTGTDPFTVKYASTFTRKVITTTYKGESVIAALMKYRKLFTQQGFFLFKEHRESFFHRLAYIPMLHSDRRSTEPILGTSHVYYQYDIDFASIPAATRDLNTILEGQQANPQTTYAAGSQGLMNSAFMYVPDLSNTYQNTIGQYINETFTISTDGAPPSKLESFICSPSDANAWDAFNTFSCSTRFPPPPWGNGKSAMHIKTQYSYRDEGTNGNTGHSSTLTLGRLNLDLVPPMS